MYIMNDTREKCSYSLSKHEKNKFNKNDSKVQEIRALNNAYKPVITPERLYLADKRDMFKPARAQPYFFSRRIYDTLAQAVQSKKVGACFEMAVIGWDFLQKNIPGITISIIDLTYYDHVLLKLEHGGCTIYYCPWSQRYSKNEQSFRMFVGELLNDYSHAIRLLERRMGKMYTAWAYGYWLIPNGDIPQRPNDYSYYISMSTEAQLFGERFDHLPPGAKYSIAPNPSKPTNVDTLGWLHYHP
tara:strand:- start:144036 stop:144764 length:729 start_codon:yes stop_codon:yes gene_type:complete